MIAIVGGITGSAADIRQAGRLLDVLEFAPAEAQAIGMVADASQLSWADADKTWDIALPAGATGLMRRAAQGYAGFLARDRRWVAALMDKLDVASAPAASAEGPA